MMEDLAMHLLELLINAVEHKADTIVLEIFISEEDERIYFLVKDNGEGMSEEFLKNATKPFTTTRTTRKVGMGLAFLKSLTDYTDGHLNIDSKINEGTIIRFDVKKDHIDLPPLGDIGETIMFTLSKKPGLNLHFVFKNDNNAFIFDTIKIAEEIGGVDYTNPSIALWLKTYINEGIGNIK